MKKIKATEITFNSMTGITIRNITFHDYERLIFVVGRERTKRQFKTLDKIVLFEGHLDAEKLNDEKYFQPDAYTKTRQFPASAKCLELDLKIWNSIKENKTLNDYYDIGEEITKTIKTIEVDSGIK